MTATVSMTVNSNAWTQVATGSRDVTVQLLNHEPCYVEVATAMPGASELGIALTRTDRAAGFANLPVTDNVYVRAVNRPSEIVVVRS